MYIRINKLFLFFIFEFIFFNLILEIKLLINLFRDLSIKFI